MTTRLVTRLFAGDRWIPLCFVGFFGVVLAANAVLVVLAVTTWTGIDTPDAYEKGLAYNEVLAAAQAQTRRGWATEVGFASAPRADAILTVTYRDRLGQPLSGGQVRARFVRPSHVGQDFDVRLEEDGPGRYAAVVEHPPPGVWDVRIRADLPGGRHVLTERVFAR